MDRAKRDADARDKSESELVALVREQVAAQSQTVASIDRLTQESRETNHITRELVATLKGRPRLLDQKENNHE
jgi:hypothetical protein